MKNSAIVRGLLVLAALAMLGAYPARATTIAGGNLINQTWTLAGSPYIVQGDVTVPAGAFLTIQPGVSVQFASTDGQAAGLDTSRVEMTIKGTLTANGTSGSPVTFRAQTGTVAGTWYGIVIDAAATSVNITNAQIQHAFEGVRSSVGGNVLHLSSSTIDTCSGPGVDILAGTPTITSVASNGNQYGFKIANASPTLSFCSGRANAQDGVNATPTSASTTIQIDHGTYDSNVNGIQIASSGAGAATASIIACNVSKNTTRGIWRNIFGGPITVTTTNSNVWSNGTNFLGGASAGAGVISSNPLYVSGTDLTITSNSPSRFGGPSAEDIGAFPYAGTATPGLYGTLWTNTTLTLAGSPYVVGGDITIPTGRTLTIDPGVTMNFGTLDIMAANTSTTKIELIPIGTLHAVGTPASRIIFTSSGVGSGSWYGIVFPNIAVASSALSYANIDETINGLTLSATAPLSFNDLSITTSSTNGVLITDGSPTLNSVQTSVCQTGVNMTGKGTPVLYNLISNANLSDGVKVIAQTGNLTATITNATIDHNGSDGVDVSSAAGPATASANVKNCLITSNTSGGVNRNMSVGPATVTTTFSDVFGNGMNFINAAPGAGVISANPSYVASGNFHLNAGSVAIDAGTPSGAPSRDFDGLVRPIDGDGIGGAAFDMGAYEYSAFAPAPGSTPETSGGPQPPLFVTTSDHGATVDLIWGMTCGNTATDYAVYRGTLGTWYSHVPVTCTTGGDIEAIFAPGSGNRYYLVVPLAPSEEGGYGHRSNGLPIPVSSSPCRPVQNLGGCP